AWMWIQFARSYQVLGDANQQYARATRASRVLAGLGAPLPDDATYRHDISVAYRETGDLLVYEGDGTAALKSYRDGLAIMEQLVPANTVWQQDLSLFNSKLGGVLMARGKSSEALNFYLADVAVR